MDNAGTIFRLRQTKKRFAASLMAAGLLLRLVRPPAVGQPLALDDHL
jgi:hypothetical protein